MMQKTSKSNKESEFAFRPGQHKALEAIVGFLKSPTQSSYILATGSFGKTVLYIKGVQEYRDLNPDKNQVLVLADSVNLLRQLEREFRALAPDLSVARASRNNPAPKADVTFASIQRCRTLLKEQSLDGLLRPLVIVDEAHVLLGQETKKLVAHMLDKGCRILGGTATDEYFADKKLSAVLGKPCYTLTYQEALELKVVAPFKTGAISLPFNMSQVAKIAGDYDRAALAVLFPAEVCADAIAQYHGLYHQGEKGYVQCLSRDHAKRTAKYLNKAGIKSAAVTGDLSEIERESIISKAKKGKLEILCGKNLLIQGIDWPAASVAYNFPSASNLAVKQRGFRVTRLDPNDPAKCATIVEIIPTQIAKTRPPLMFREAVDGGIHLKGWSASRENKLKPARAPADKPGLYSVESDAVEIINDVLKGSGPWAKLTHNMPTPEKLHELVTALDRSTLESLYELSKHDQFSRVLELLALKAMRHHRNTQDVPKLGQKIEESIEQLSLSELSLAERTEALREIQRFLFGPVKYRKDADTVSAIGLSPLFVADWLRDYETLNETDPWKRLRKLLPIQPILASLNEMHESVSALAELFEPLIECQATLRGLNGKRFSDESDWYFRGAKILMESILLHDGTAAKRFQSYLNSKIAEEFQKLRKEYARSKERRDDLHVLYQNPRRLDLLTIEDPEPSKASILHGDNLKNLREPLLEHLKETARASSSPNIRNRRLKLAEIYVQAFVEGEDLGVAAFQKRLQDGSGASLRADIMQMGQEVRNWLMKQDPSLQDRVPHDGAGLYLEDVSLHVPESLKRFSYVDARRLFQWLDCSADPFSKHGERFRRLGGMSKQLGAELKTFIASSMLHQSYKEILSTLVEHLVQPADEGRDVLALFKTDQFCRNGWLAAREATQCLAVLLVPGNSRYVQLIKFSGKLPFEVTYEHLFAAGLEPHPGDVLVESLRNNLKFHAYEYAKSGTVSEDYFSYVYNSVIKRIPGWSELAGSDSLSRYFHEGSKRGLFGKTMAELRVEPPTGRHDPLFCAYFSLSMEEQLARHGVVFDSAERSRIDGKVKDFFQGSSNSRALREFLGEWLMTPIDQLKRSVKADSEVMRVIELHEASPLARVLEMGKSRSLYNLYSGNGSQGPNVEAVNLMYKLACDYGTRVRAFDQA